VEVWWLSEGGLAVLTDFDDTAITLNIPQMILSKHVYADWRGLDRLFEANRISFEDCLRSQYSLITLTEEQILEEVKGSIQFREGFDTLVEACGIRNVPLTIVSGGFDFVIRSVLLERGWVGRVGMTGTHIHFAPSGMIVDFPRPRSPAYHNFKDDLVSWNQRMGRKVIYVGDGLSDYEAVRLADAGCVIANSMLARLCKENSVDVIEVADFNEVVRAVEGWSLP